MPAAKIVLIDDNIEVLDFCRIILSQKYEVITESDSLKALEVIQREKPDLVVLDLKMPRIDGFKIFDKLKEDDETNRIPVLFVTAATQDEDIPNAFWQKTLGCDGFLTKPFSPSDLLNAVEKVFRKKYKLNEKGSGPGFI